MGHGIRLARGGIVVPLVAALALAGCSASRNGAGDVPAAERWVLVGGFEEYSERIEGTVWLDETRKRLRFELEGTDTRLKCIGAGEIDSATLGNGQCPKLEGDFRLHCGVQRELFGSFEHSECGFGFAAGIDTLSGATVVMHFDLSPERQAERERLLAERSANRPPMEEAGEYLEDGGLDPDIYSLGTGFAITTDGLILTAAHVVDDEYGIKVLADGRVAEAAIVAIDREIDLALLQTDLAFDPLPLLPRADAPGEAFPGLAVGYRTPPDAPPSQAVEPAYMARLGDEPLYVFAGDVIPGYSGGPVFVSPDFKVAGVLQAISVHYELDDWNDYRIDKLAYAANYETMMDFLERSLDAPTMATIAARSGGAGAADSVVQSDAIVLVTVY